MNTALQILEERGFIQQCSNLEGLSARMDEGPVSFYVGIDPTGASLHIGHMLPAFALRHLTEAGHKGWFLIGGGTARIGDPSGKTDMRKMLSYEQLDTHSELVEKQLRRFVPSSNKNIFFENNKHWLANLNYIDFLRTIGSHFSVNKMLTFEAYKKRMETGLSFLEFNYQLLQSYDFLQLYEREGVELQIGGDDQWGNILAGTDLVRRIHRHEVFALTFPLITRADGKKMGKTEKGALFLDPQLCSPYDFFQYFRNVPDADVRTLLLLFTFLSVNEIDQILHGDINKAKERLAYEITLIIHGEKEAEKARAGAHAAFGGGADKDAMPSVTLPRSVFEEGIPAPDLFVRTGLAASKSEARRLIMQGGALVNTKKITEVSECITVESLDSAQEIVLKAGKKRFIRVVLARST